MILFMVLFFGKILSSFDKKFFAGSFSVEVNLGKWL